MAAKPKKPWETTEATTEEVVATPVEESAVTEEVAVETPTEEVVTEEQVVEPEATTEEEIVAVEGELLDMVIAVVPKQFTLNLDHHKQFTYKPGTQRMERDHANHWWSVANGVTIFKG